MTHLDTMIGNNNHVYKNKKTVADAYAFVMARWTELLEKTWKDYPNIKRFMECINEDASVKKVLSEM